jgi:RND superfamily putative drug exporter
MERWTRFVLRHRAWTLGVWGVVLVAGVIANTGLSKLLSNEFSVPGTDSERARAILKQDFGQRDDGTYLVVFKVPNAKDQSVRQALEAKLRAAAAVVPGGKAEALQPAGQDVLFGNVTSPLALTQAKNYTQKVRDAIGQPLGAKAYVTGQAAIQTDLDPIFKSDLAKGEAIALPIALLVLIAVFGVSLAVLIPFIFAACTIFATLGIVFLVAHQMSMAIYVTNLVQLIGLGIAIDYSLLVVYRFREELARGLDKDEAIVKTMATAGRAVVFSGGTVAIGLALLLFMPLPFMRSMGVGGFLIPLISIGAAVTLQPALLSVWGRKGMKSVLFGGTPSETSGFWHWLSGNIMRRPVAFLAAGVALLLALALPAFTLKLTPGSAFGSPQTPESMQGFNVLRDAVGPGALSPVQIVVDAGKGEAAVLDDMQAAIGRLIASVKRDPEVALVNYQLRQPFIDETGRYAQITVAGRHEYGQEQSQAFARRLRSTIIPAARFPAGVHVLAGGGPPQGIDFLDRSYQYFPWLVAAVLVLTYLLLMRAFRSIVLPLKAVLLNLLSVGASYGALVIVFKWGLGKDLLGLYKYSQLEGWIPIFLFAMLFGLSMDYEVFLVTRMREAWDEGEDNAQAVAHGLERTGRIVTAAAIVMVAAFSGFVAGSILGLQEFGLGLAVAIFVDATIVRAILVPSLMALFGRYNWWLPGSLAKLVRVRPSPLERHPPAALRPAGR